MPLIVKVMHAPGAYPGSDIDAPSSIFADVSSVHFTDHTVKLWCIEPVKTALVPGFCEIEKNVDRTGDVFVMNEHGKTVSRHAHPSGRGQTANGSQTAA